ncbi:MAG: tRNA adenosine(34) deaminase TadA [Gammaproteobacteria bacterium]|nr:tRNA adenosine(34) deaminase TadA [Gammaproteobacteria bacterium]
MNDEVWMQHALDLAKQAEAAGEVPVGAVIVLNGDLIAEGWNQPISSSDPTAHAEIIALRQAGESLGNYRLLDIELYVTLEPCPMCVGAMLHARVKRVIYAATDPKTGALGGAYDLLNSVGHNHSFEVTKGVMEEQSRAMLQNFFKSRR